MVLFLSPLVTLSICAFFLMDKVLFDRILATFDAFLLAKAAIASQEGARTPAAAGSSSNIETAMASNPRRMAAPVQRPGKQDSKSHTAADRLRHSRALG